MNLDELRTVQSKERQKDSLQHLRPSFYQEVADYIATLEAERERAAEAADDPFSSPDVGRLTDEIETAKDVVEAIYERRMGKLVKQASLAAAGMPADDEGLTAEESDLFDDLVDRIRSNKGRVLDVLEGAADASSDVDTGEDETEGTTDSSVRESKSASAKPGDAGSEPVAGSGDSAGTESPPIPPEESPGEASTGSDSDSSVSVADVMGGDAPTTSLPNDDSASDEAERVPDRDAPRESTDGAVDTDGGATEPDGLETDERQDGSNENDVDRVTVRITRDVGSILGVDDREYTLSSDDVVTLPEQNATPLVERDAAEQLN